MDKPGWNCLHEDIYYRKVEVYRRCWDFEFSALKLFGCPNGGPLATTRDESKFVRADEVSKPSVDFYTSSGIALASVKPSNFGDIVNMGWNNAEQFVIVQTDGTVVIYSILGEEIRRFNMDGDCQSPGIIDAKIWGTGLLVLTKNLKLFAVTDFESPYTIELKNPNLTEPPKSWVVMTPELSWNQQLEVYLATSTTVLCVREDSVQDMLIDKGPFLRMSLSSNGKILAAFSSTGNVWIVQSDFSQTLSTFDTQSSRPPKQMEWCGADAVICYWETDKDHLLFMIGPKSKWLRYTYNGSLFLISEVDGVRILSQEGCEFLQRVPKVTTAIYSPGSLAPVAMLVYAYDLYEQGNPKSDHQLRSIKMQNQLEDAVDACIDAASFEFDIDTMKRFLGAASFGKGRIRTSHYNSDKFVETSKVLRVVNAVRDPQIGMPLTVQQYNLLSADLLIERLVQRHKHLLATNISSYLSLKTDHVLIHWAITKVQQTQGSAQSIVQQIVEKFSAVPGISYSTVANEAHRCDRDDIATLLLDYEPRPSHQVPLLLTINDRKSNEKALQYAIRSCDTDLIDLCLHTTLSGHGEEEFERLLKAYPEAYAIHVKQCLTTDPKKLDQLYRLESNFAGIAYICCKEALSATNEDVRLTNLKMAYAHYQRADLFAAKATEEEISLHIAQAKLEKQVAVKVVGLSVSETVSALVSVGEDQKANDFLLEFKVPPKRGFWVRVKALAASGKWKALRELSDRERSPIGYAPFAEFCIKYQKEDEAPYYIEKMGRGEPDKQVLMWGKIGEWSKALHCASKLKDRNEVLFNLRPLCTEPSVITEIDALMRQPQ
eukprot:TRINITY_DN3386_c0_g4_i1.p1 TRINITY_DN3386_c0_g4~~TRINITY_DN3386_c0_g4_i1.p1  ORF type:complete len:829 (-),score=130.60 TRINITY_DN3386_c0_g4_i1:29-2515(-)